jgi:hypothetical protein
MCSTSTFLASGSPKATMISYNDTLASIGALLELKCDATHFGKHRWRHLQRKNDK